MNKKKAWRYEPRGIETSTTNDIFPLDCLSVGHATLFNQSLRCSARAPVRYWIIAVMMKVPMGRQNADQASEWYLGSMAVVISVSINTMGAAKSVHMKRMPNTGLKKSSSLLADAQDAVTMATAKIMTVLMTSQLTHGIPLFHGSTQATIPAIVVATRLRTSPVLTSRTCSYIAFSLVRVRSNTLFNLNYYNTSRSLCQFLEYWVILHFVSYHIFIRTTSIFTIYTLTSVTYQKYNSSNKHWYFD